jgi:hypothetical protein
MFTALYLALTVLLGARLNSWDEEKAGKCYDGRLTSSPGAHHPSADKLYVAITGSWLLVSTYAAVYGARKRFKAVLGFGLLQFPVHLYMLIALRTVNQSLFEGGEGENDWGFGQTVALVLLADTLISCLKGLKGRLDLDLLLL